MSLPIADINPADFHILAPVAEMAEVQRLQQKLATKISWLTKAFGKAYREERGDGIFVPEVFIGPAATVGGKEYMEVWPDTSVTGMCFFDIDQEIDAIAGSGQTLFEVDVRIIFYVDLEKAFPLLGTRADAEARQEVINYIMFHRRGFEITKVITGVDNVYSSYNWTQPEAAVNKQPFFVFSVECKLVFDGYKICN